MKRFLIGFSALTCLILAAGMMSCGRSERNPNAKRYVVLSPEVAEIIAALDAEDSIVGITQECNYPASLRKIRKVGNFGSVDKEAVIALKPDLIFTSALEQDALAQEFAKLGITVEQIYPRLVSDIPRVVKHIGTLIGKEMEAAALADSLERSIADIKTATAGKPRPKVYLEIYRDPLMSVSDQSFVGDLIETAGGDNIFDQLERDYCRIDAEDVIRARPEIMICYSQDTLRNILSRKGWQDIPAIRNKRVYFEKDIDPDWIQRATPRALLGLKRLSEIFSE